MKSLRSLSRESTAVRTASNALLGVYNSYTQANTKVLQSYFYQDISWCVQDTWKLTPRFTLDLGMRFSYYERFHNILGPESFFNPSLFDPAKATRIYRPVCVGTATCSAGQAAYSAVNRTTNITNGVGATGANIFNDFTNLSTTNNTRPSGNTNVLGTYFGEYSAARDPRFIQLAVKVYF